MQRALCRAVALAAGILLAEAGQQASEVDARANPVRKVVTLLQAMQKKVEAEGEAEKKLYEKFRCYCKKGGGDLAASISAASAKVPSVGSDIEAAEAKLGQTKEDLKKAQSDRSAAKDAKAQATAIREKEHASYVAEKAEYDANIGAITKAVAALEKGMAGGFLQTDAAQVLRQLVQGKQDLLDADRQELLSFLSAEQGSGYAPKSGEVTGILKELGDTMAKALADATGEEKAAVAAYESLMAAKAKEVAALSASVEAKTKQIGELGVQIVQMKEDLSDTEAALLEDQKFFAELEKSCATKDKEWEERSKTRSEELVALAETIKLLNDDDALELFKKTLPSTGASFVQVRTRTTVPAKALVALRAARQRAGADQRAGLDFLVLALSSKKALSRGGFDKVIKMCDSMVEVLQKEQDDDEHKKEYCAKQFDMADDKKKALERSLSGEENAAATATEALAALAEEIGTLEKGIKALDKSVLEATEQRKEEHTEFQELMSSDAAAKELLGVAKNRLNRFYNPKLYKAPPKKELSREGRIFSNMGGTVLAEVSSHGQRALRKDAPAPPPATWNAYARKSQESTGVIAMLDLLIKDLDKEMTEAQTAEKDAQADYEAMMSDAAAKRTKDSKSLSDKVEAKAETEAELESHKEAKAAATQEHMATMKYIHSLHSECDWLVQNFDMRKDARAGEIDSLKQAKAILSGADYSLLETASGRGFLARAQ